MNGNLATYVFGSVLATACLVTDLSAVEVSIQGEVDTSGHLYEWRIWHDHSAPLVYVEIPHFRVDMFTAPDGWSAEIENQNSPDLKPGRCLATATDPSRGIRKGDQGTFTARVNPTSAPVGVGVIKCRFADGVEATAQARVPVKSSSLEQWAPAGLLGGFFLAYVAYASRKRKRQVRTAESGDDFSG